MSPLADQLAEQHRTAVLEAGGIFARSLRAVAMAASVGDIDSWWALKLPVIEEQAVSLYLALAKLARGYLVNSARADGAKLVPQVVTPSREQIRTSLTVTGPVEFKTNLKLTGSEDVAKRTMSTTLSRSGQRLVTAGSRDTIMTTAQKSPAVVGWRRNAAGGACAFCQMLAGRGSVYGSEKTADFQAHDGCGCMPQPLYRREPEPARVQEFQDSWDQVTRGLSGKKALAAWQAHVREQRKANPPPTG